MYRFPHELQPERETFCAPLGAQSTIVDLPGIRTALLQQALAKVYVEYGHVSHPNYACDESELPQFDNHEYTAALWDAILKRRMRYDWWLALALQGREELAMELNRQPYEVVDIVDCNVLDRSITFFNFTWSEFTDAEIESYRRAGSRYLATSENGTLGVVLTDGLSPGGYFGLDEYGLVFIERQTASEDAIFGVLELDTADRATATSCNYSNYNGTWLVRGIKSVHIEIPTDQNTVDLM